MKNKSLSTDRFFESLKKETRYCILECTVFLEEKASDTLGRLLRINWKKSESLGYRSASLGFDDKIRLIKDLKDVTKQDKTKFQSFMAIRNKFAHIAEIDSFVNYFKIIPSSKERKKEFEKWFPNLNCESEDIEGVYKVAFFLLTLDLYRVLFDIDIKHAVETGKERGRKEAQKLFISNVMALLRETEKGNEILEETIKNVMNKYGG